MICFVSRSDRKERQRPTMMEIEHCRPIKSATAVCRATKTRHMGWKEQFLPPATCPCESSLSRFSTMIIIMSLATLQATRRSWSAMESCSFLLGKGLGEGERGKY